MSTNTELEMPSWAPPDGPWCLKQWIPFNSAPAKWTLCLMAPGHRGDCRDAQERQLNYDTAMFLGVLEPSEPQPPEMGSIWLYPGDSADPYSRVFVEIKPPTGQDQLNPCFYTYGFGAIECELPTELAGLTLERWDALVHSKKLLPLGELDKLIPKEA
jgi:hypothetical protein